LPTFASRIADGTVALIDQYGHVPQVEKPKYPLDRVSAFLAR
jgi:hypothetical protein